jgi:hypothetical protein
MTELNYELRLEELGKVSDKDYEEFRIRQYGYCAGAAAVLPWLSYWHYLDH